MTAELLQRIRKEFTLTLTALHETVLAVSDRVNRKVHILKLHWQASSIAQQMETIQQETGAFLTQHATQSDASEQTGYRQDQREIETRLSEAAARARLLKNELLRVDALVRELEAETLTEDLIKIQQDLLIRSATIERIIVAKGSAACGQTIGQLGMPPAIRVMAILRGPMLVTACDTVPFRAGDVALLIGPRADLKNALPSFTDTQRAFA